MTKQQSEREEAIAFLRETLKPGDTVYTVLRHVSRSGMSRNIDLYVMEENHPRWISRVAARAMGVSFNEKKECIRAGGCGMDIGFHLVYNLGRALFQDLFTCIGTACPSNDHNNSYHANRAGNCVVCGQPCPCRNVAVDVRHRDSPKAVIHDWVYIRQFGTRAYGVCSPECAHKEWVHSDGGYALRHKWM